VTPAISLANLTKTFPVERHSATLYRAVRDRMTAAPRYPRRYCALRDISFDVLPGEWIGVVGDNGAGKTTLLKVAAGLYEPNGGTVVVDGTVTLLAGLGLGMIEELTVEENVFLYGAIYGVPRGRLRHALGDIIDWAELGEFQSARLKTISTGMKTRLAFSITRYIDAEIFLFDEALTAGDKSFRTKCEDVFRAYQARNKTFVIATHDLGFVTAFCAKALWLHKSQLMAFGEAEMVVRQYREARSS
jgi:ABC-type polysaccharide/polyol phosphate transport system ATPase subunit